MICAIEKLFAELIHRVASSTLILGTLEGALPIVLDTTGVVF
jgi:hypothetical protein